MQGKVSKKKVTNNAWVTWTLFIFFPLVTHSLCQASNHSMAQQAKQAAQRLGGMFPKGSGKGIGGAAGAIITLGALGYGINASLFNGNYGCAFFLVRKKKTLLLNTLHYS